MIAATTGRLAALSHGLLSVRAHLIGPPRQIIGLCSLIGTCNRLIRRLGIAFHRAYRYARSASAVVLAGIVCAMFILGGTALATYHLPLPLDPTGRSGNTLIGCLVKDTYWLNAPACHAARQSFRVTIWILLCCSWWPACWGYRLVRLRSALPGRTHGPVPLFAIASLRSSRSGKQPKSSDRTRTLLVPFGVGRPAVGTGIAVGGLVAIAFFGHAPVGIWHDLKVLTFFVALFVLIALAPAYLTVRAETASPLDDYLQRTSRTARPRLEEGMGLIPELDSKLGRWYPGLFAPDFHDSRFANLVTFALGTWFGVVTTSMRPDRLTSLVHLRRHGQQRELLCYGLGRVIIGRPASDLEPVPLTHNARFIALYFGHALATFGGIMVAVVALVFANYTGLSEHEGNPMRVLSGAVLLWWSLMLLYAFSACSRDIAILREDLVNTRSSPYLPTSLQDWHSIEPLLGLLDAATVNWIPKTVGLASTVMLVAALAAIQALEAAP